jgi:hypothetical protein
MIITRALQDPGRVISSVHVERLSGVGWPIFHILVNTSHRWIDHRVLSDRVEFVHDEAGNDPCGSDYAMGPRLEFDVPTLPGGRYMAYSSQEKDQIYVVLVPHFPRTEARERTAADQDRYNAAQKLMTLAKMIEDGDWTTIEIDEVRSVLTCLSRGNL